ncbi:hypothetical protein [Anaerococcus sp.]|uniref:hypothetical protein n=1 Tax=Anaerococcus sp. TaxID=1872515 RepID=UPI002902B2A4|nr:hypothetical protein [Anaerococcus sp.]MDU3212360.1 hypothetical protein [Anaerococcus sp.]
MKKKTISTALILAIGLTLTAPSVHAAKDLGNDNLIEELNINSKDLDGIKIEEETSSNPDKPSEERTSEPERKNNKRN